MDDALSVTLKPATIKDKQRIFEWLTKSNLAAEMFGEPKFPDNPVPTWKEFDEDYIDVYFDGSNPQMGRCFIISHDGVEVGQINYNPIDPITKTTELDIWLADKRFTGMGIGTTAIRLLCRYLFDHMDCRRILIQPSARNSNAIKAYKKAGFTEMVIVPDHFKLDYFDSVVLELVL